MTPSTTHPTPADAAADRVRAAEAANAAAWAALVAAAADEAERRAADDPAAWAFWPTSGARTARVLGDPQDPRTQAAARRQARTRRALHQAEEALLAAWVRP